MVQSRFIAKPRIWRQRRPLQQQCTLTPAQRQQVNPLTVRRRLLATLVAAALVLLLLVSTKLLVDPPSLPRPPSPRLRLRFRRAQSRQAPWRLGFFLTTDDATEYLVGRIRLNRHLPSASELAPPRPITISIVACVGALQISQSAREGGIHDVFCIVE